MRSQVKDYGITKKVIKTIGSSQHDNRKETPLRKEDNISALPQPLELSDVANERSSNKNVEVSESIPIKSSERKKKWKDVKLYLKVCIDCKIDISYHKNNI